MDGCVDYIATAYLIGNLLEDTHHVGPKGGLGVHPSIRVSDLSK